MHPEVISEVLAKAVLIVISCNKVLAKLGLFVPFLLYRSVVLSLY